MKARIPKSFLNLPQKEKDIINETMAELLNDQINKEEAELQKIWLQLACIVLNRHFGFGKIRLRRFLGAWKRIYAQNARCGSKTKQAEFLSDNMAKIFGSEGYPFEWVDKLAEG